METAALQVTRDGDWLPADEIRDAMVAAMSDEGPVGVDLAGVDHLDARPLQVLLAFFAERQSLGRTIRLRHVSDGLARWFGHVGAASLLQLIETDREN
jgi:anti-anti-sigma regulatory factor